MQSLAIVGGVVSGIETLAILILLWYYKTKLVAVEAERDAAKLTAGVANVQVSSLTARLAKVIADAKETYENHLAAVEADAGKIHDSADAVGFLRRVLHENSGGSSPSP